MPNEFFINGANAEKLASKYGTPLYVLDEQTIRKRIAELKQSSYTNRLVRFAMKAWSSKQILTIVNSEGLGIDAVSIGEVYRALKAGIPASKILYTADIFTQGALEYLLEKKILINCGSLDMVKELLAKKPNAKFSIRINPGEGHGHSKKTNTGGPSSKHGIWFSEIPEVLKLAEKTKAKVIGCHIHIGSGSDFEHLARISQKTVEFSKQFPHLEFVNFGGGIPVPYKPLEQRMNLQEYDKILSEQMRALSNEKRKIIRMEIEPGRYIVAEAGFLLARVKAVKKTPEFNFILCDAGFNDLIRPMAYGSYHEIKIVGKEVNDLQLILQVVAGPLCESGDVFTQEQDGTLLPRNLPQAKVGDLVIFENAGAYGSSMGMNYNSRLKATEVIVSKGKARLIRKREKLEDLARLEV